MGVGGIKYGKALTEKKRKEKKSERVKDGEREKMYNLLFDPQE